MEWACLSTHTWDLIETCKKKLSIQSFVHPCALQLRFVHLKVYHPTGSMNSRIPLPRSKISAGSANWALPALHLRRNLCRCSPPPAARHDVVLRSRLLQHMERPGGCSCGGPKDHQPKKSTGKNFQLNFPQKRRQWIFSTHWHDLLLSGQEDSRSCKVASKSIRKVLDKVAYKNCPIKFASNILLWLLGIWLRPKSDQPTVAKARIDPIQQSHIPPHSVKCYLKTMLYNFVRDLFYRSLSDWTPPCTVASKTHIY